MSLLVFFLLVFTHVTYAQGYRSAPGQVERFTVAAPLRPSATPIYVGIDKGYFKEEGLDVTLLPVETGEKGLNALLFGQADAAGAAPTPIAQSAVRGDRIAVIATIAEIREANVIIAKKGGGIAGPGDLRGKTVAVPQGTGAAFFLHIYLVAHYINPAEVRIVDIAPEKIVDALLEDQVEAVCTWSPYKLMLLEKLGANAVVLADPDLYLQTINLVTTRDLAARSPERIEKFLRGVVRADNFIKENPRESRAIMAKRIGIESDLYEREWSHYNFTAVLEQRLVLNLEDQARWILRQEAHASKEFPNFMDFIDAEPLKAVHPPAVRIIGK